MTVIIEIVVGL